jgi:hypothetical protein
VEEVSMILRTITLAAAGGSSTDPWHVLGNSYADRLAIAALADLTLLRRLRIAPAADDESPAARRLEVLAGGRPDGALGDACDALMSSTKQLDIDRAVRLLRDIAPEVEAELRAAGDLVPAGQKGVLKKRTVLVPRQESIAVARARIREPADPRLAEPRALVLIATTGMPTKRLTQLCGGAVAMRPDPFDAFPAASIAPDGQPLGDNAADLMTALVTVLAATSDTTNDFD